MFELSLPNGRRRRVSLNLIACGTHQIDLALWHATAVLTAAIDV